jgi:hypothetical protein
MAKCCCSVEIDNGSRKILQAIAAQGGIKQGAMPPFQRTQDDAEEIARRVADELNKYQNPFERTTTLQLDAIVNALIGIRSRLDNQDKLNQILRNQNDTFDLIRANQRELNRRVDSLATREQAKDLLAAIASLRRDMLQQFVYSAREIATRFAAIGAAIIALGVAQRAAFLAELTAKAAQTATILRAIAALKFNQGASGLDAIAAQIADLLDNQLSLEPVTTLVPYCGRDSQGNYTILQQPIQSYAIKDASGASTASFQLTLNGMVNSLLASGQLQCSGGFVLQQETLLEVDKEDIDATEPKILYPQELSAIYYTITLTEVSPISARTYKLGGTQTEYGAGNWAIVDSNERVVGDFIRIFNRNQRLQAPQGISLPGLRVSLKPGISAIVRAFGIPNQ